MNNANTIKFRCSSLGHLMTEARSKSEPISETTKTHLVDVYVSEVYGRQTDIMNKYIEKGNQVEDDSITLFSRVNKTFFRKNEDHLSNDFIKGTPDLFVGEKIYSATEIIDIKSSWDIFTFFRTKTKDVNKMYYWQLMGYMALTGAQKATLAYCLVNTPETLVNDEKRKLHWKMGLIDDNHPSFVEACEKIDKLSYYDDIPMDERILTIQVERNEADIERIYQRVMDCRNWMNTNLFNKNK